MEVKHLTTAELEAGLDEVRKAPTDEGTLDMIVRRPETLEREILEAGELSVDDGLVGDNWKARGSGMTDDGKAHPEMQLNIMGSRAIDLIATSKDRWHLAGDQLFIDINLGPDNLPPGTQLTLGSAVIEVTAMPHTGCKKFVERYGADAMKFVNSDEGSALRTRGINAKVVKGGTIKVGDVVRKKE
jgi:hypothetical protein